MIMDFEIARLPRIRFGAGAIRDLPELVAGYGSRHLIVTGARSFAESDAAEALWAAMRERGLAWECLAVACEPSPEFIDEAVADLRGSGDFDAVIGIGGGSALDAAKAVAGLLKPGNSVMDHLEGVGPELPYEGPATPFIAVPTTAGTGSEATKNAVLSRLGPDGFKKSFRDEALVARHAIVDADLMARCPPALIAANGMDAATQLLESFVSTRSGPLTDALALSGLAAVRDGLMVWYEGGAAAAEARDLIAYAALLSGICLAQTGLGAVHGLAPPLGAYFGIAHGLACGTLVEAATMVNIKVMEESDRGNPALAKYAEAGKLLRGHSQVPPDVAREFLVHKLGEWTKAMALPKLSQLGVTAADIPRVVAASRGSSMRTNPVVLTDAEIAEIVEARL